MVISVFNSRALQDEAAAYRWVETQVWPDGPICPHCGGVDRISLMRCKSTRIGTYKCYQCRKPFTAKVGTVFEASHIPMFFLNDAVIPEFYTLSLNGAIPICRDTTRAASAARPS